MQTHRYGVRVTWSGNRGTGTSGYAAYGRDHAIEADGKPPIEASADPAFRGDAGKWNPEELFVAAPAAAGLCAAAPATAPVESTAMAADALRAWSCTLR